MRILFCKMTELSRLAAAGGFKICTRIQLTLCVDHFELYGFLSKLIFSIERRGVRSGGGFN